MTAFRIDLLDPNSGAKTGSHPITTATSVTRRRALDRIDSWSFPCAAVDPALTALEGKDFAVYWQWAGATRYLGQCSYLKHELRAGGDSPSVAVSAAGRLRDLQRQTVLQRAFDGASDDVNDVLSTIVPLRSGWALGSVDIIAKAAPMDFWYESIFDGVALLAETFGYHFREGSADKTLDFGAFGASSGILAVGGGQRELPPGIYGNENLCHITDVSVRYQGEQVVNRLIPFGGAVGVATIDLSETTSTQTGYDVESAALPGSGSYYYIEDAASISTYGLTERRFLRKDLRPITNSADAREYAANILYEAGLASLLNLKDRQTVYDVSVTGLAPGVVRPGDKINILFRGWASTSTGERIWLDIGDTSGQGKEFYVLEIEETFGEGVSTRLKINENAVHEETVEDLLARTVKGFEQAQIHVQPTISRYTVGPYTKRVKADPSGVDATFSFKLGPETLDVWYVKLLLKGEPLKSSIDSVAGASTTTPAGGGGTSAAGASHSHDTIPFNRQLVSVQNSNHKALYIHQNDEDFHFFTNDAGPSVTTPTSASEATHTHSFSDHQHTFTPNLNTVYGLFEDSVRPDDLTIKVNGTTVDTGVTLSGPDYDYELDITSDILDAANLQQEHTITVECGSDRGEIQFQAQVLAVIQGIAVN